MRSRQRNCPSPQKRKISRRTAPGQVVSGSKNCRLTTQFRQAQGSSPPNERLPVARFRGCLRAGADRERQRDSSAECLIPLGRISLLGTAASRLFLSRSLPHKPHSAPTHCRPLRRIAACGSPPRDRRHPLESPAEHGASSIAQRFVLSTCCRVSRASRKGQLVPVRLNAAVRPLRHQSTSRVECTE
jgi:hypothetical protein